MEASGNTEETRDGNKRPFEGEEENSSKRYSGGTRTYGKLLLLIPVETVNIFMSRNSAVLKEISEQSGCKLMLQPAHSIPRGSKDRGLILNGYWEQIHSAELLVLQHLINRSPFEEYADVPEGQELLKWFIPAESCGSLIGKGGETIRKITEVSGAKVKLISEEETPNSAIERIVTLTGTPEMNAKAKEMIQAKVGGSATPADVIAEEETYPIPTGAIGTIIGTAGGVVKALCDESGAKIMVMTDSELPMGLLETPVKILGTDTQVEKAKQLLAAKVEQWKNDNPEEAIVENRLEEKTTTIKTAIPQLLVGHLIGKKGVIINEINASTKHAWCKVLPKARCPSTTLDLKVLVYGGKIGEMLNIQKRVLDRLASAPSHVLEEVRQAERLASSTRPGTGNYGGQNQQGQSGSSSRASYTQQAPAMGYTPQPMGYAQPMMYAPMPVAGQPMMGYNYNYMPQQMMYPAAMPNGQQVVYYQYPQNPAQQARR